MIKKEKDKTLLTEYDFSKGKRGKYAKRFAEGSNIVVIEPDLVNMFPDSDTVNTVLHKLLSILNDRKKTIS